MLKMYYSKQGVCEYTVRRVKKRVHVSDLLYSRCTSSASSQVEIERKNPSPHFARGPQGERVTLFIVERVTLLIAPKLSFHYTQTMLFPRCFPSLFPRGFHLLIKFLSLRVVLFLKSGTHTHVENFAYILNKIRGPTKASFDRPLIHGTVLNKRTDLNHLVCWATTCMSKQMSTLGQELQSHCSPLRI